MILSTRFWIWSTEVLGCLHQTAIAGKATKGQPRFYRRRSREGKPGNVASQRGLMLGCRARRWGRCCDRGCRNGGRALARWTIAFSGLMNCCRLNPADLPRGRITNLWRRSVGLALSTSTSAAARANVERMRLARRAAFTLNVALRAEHLLPLPVSRWLFRCHDNHAQFFLNSPLVVRSDY